MNAAVLTLMAGRYGAHPPPAGCRNVAYRFALLVVENRLTPNVYLLSFGIGNREEEKPRVELSIAINQASGVCVSAGPVGAHRRAAARCRGANKRCGRQFAERRRSPSADESNLLFLGRSIKSNQAQFPAIGIAPPRLIFFNKSNSGRSPRRRGRPRRARSNDPPLCTRARGPACVRSYLTLMTSDFFFRGPLKLPTLLVRYGRERSGATTAVGERLIFEIAIENLHGFRDAVFVRNAEKYENRKNEDARYIVNEYLHSKRKNKDTCEHLYGGEANTVWHAYYEANFVCVAGGAKLCEASGGRRAINNETVPRPRAEGGSLRPGRAGAGNLINFREPTTFYVAREGKVDVDSLKTDTFYSYLHAFR
ncbi:hypothetical protein EVAR_48874_1 [Eumeta japonica]|uniref:Uncharacterized protein n=1 Tax=Eumeta variegata TaxID=151549 RepID=A0A4C1Y8M0_EUMVA|nr:hypothetical protein EVAR_48874_1 [Eumeta japonica]